MTPNEKKALAQRYYEEFWRKGNADAADELLAPEIIDHSAPGGAHISREDWKDVIRGWRAGFADMHEELEFLRDAEDGCVVTRFVITGTHTGDFFGIPATHRKVRITGTEVLRMVDGVIVEIWYNEDTLGLLQQLGVTSIADLNLPGTGA